MLDKLFVIHFLGWLFLEVNDTLFALITKTTLQVQKLPFKYTLQLLRDYFVCVESLRTTLSHFVYLKA